MRKQGDDCPKFNGRFQGTWMEMMKMSEQMTCRV
jgi:hypothetical protein